MAAERVGDRGDDADFADIVVEAVAARRFGTFVRDLNQRTEFRHPPENFVECDHYIGRPDAILFEGHELDEANDNVFFARELPEGDDLVFIEAAQQDAIHFHGGESGAASGAVRDLVQGAQISAPLGKYSAAVDVLEALGTSRAV